MKKKIFLLVFAGFIFLFSSCVTASPVPEGPKQFLLISSRPDPTPEWGTTGSQESPESLLISSAFQENFMQKEHAEKAATQKAKEQSERAIDMFRKMKKKGLKGVIVYNYERQHEKSAEKKARLQPCLSYG